MLAACDFSPRASIADDVLGALPNDVELPLKCHVVCDFSTAPDINLAHDGLTGLCRIAERGIICRHGAPAKNGLAFFSDNFFENLFALGALLRVLGQENLAHAIFFCARQCDLSTRRGGLQKFMGCLQQYASAVTGIGFATAGATVIQLHQGGNGVAQNGVRLLAFEVGDETDATRVVLELRVVETLGFGCGLHIMIGLLRCGDFSRCAGFRWNERHFHCWRPWGGSSTFE